TRYLCCCCAAPSSCGGVGRPSFPERLSGRMTDPFVDAETVEGFHSMSRATEPTSGRSASAAAHGGNGGSNGGTSANGGHHAALADVAAASSSPAPSQAAAPQTVREFLVGKHVCPFCGTPNPVGVQP